MRTGTKGYIPKTDVCREHAFHTGHDPSHPSALGVYSKRQATSHPREAETRKLRIIFHTQYTTKMLRRRPGEIQETHTATSFNLAPATSTQMLRSRSGEIQETHTAGPVIRHILQPKTSNIFAYAAQKARRNPGDPRSRPEG